MSKNDIIRKITSRKLWLSVASFVSMLFIACGKSQSDAAQISALIIAGATVIAYVIGEGLVDYSGASSDGIEEDRNGDGGRNP